MQRIIRFNAGALKIASVFFIISFLWILFSDRFLFFILNDASQITRFQTFKGWFYISSVTIFLFYLINREINKKNNLIRLMNKKNEWYKILISNIPGLEVMLFDQIDGYLMVHGLSGLLTAEYMEMNFVDDSIELSVEKSKLKLYELKSKVLNGESIKFETTINGKNLEVIGQPISDDNNVIIAGLLVILDLTRHKQIVNELNAEKRNYEALFKEYHAVNLELKESYQKLLQNINLLEESNERYEAFLMQTTEAVYRVDLRSPVEINMPVDQQIDVILKNAFFAEYNPVFANIYELGDKDKIIGKHFENLNNSELKNIIETLINEIVKNKYKIRNKETCEHSKNGPDKYFLNNIIGMVEHNKLYRLWGTKTDISKLKKYEGELIEAKLIAERSDKLKSAFLANMSHEIRTPLNGIIGFSELLFQNDLSDDQRKKFITIIKTSNSQLLRIIDDILDISRIETNQLSITYEVFHLNILLHELELYAQQEIRKRLKDIQIIVKKGFTDDDDNFFNDKQRIYQVLTNLLNNAVKFTKQGVIEFGYYTDSDSTITFYVSDTGIGIPSSELSSIFLQFKQVEDYTSRLYGGTGLGLAISKGIAELLGGKIHVKSELDKGSVFTLQLPLVKKEITV